MTASTLLVMKSYKPYYVINQLTKLFNRITVLNSKNNACERYYLYSVYLPCDSLFGHLSLKSMPDTHTHTHKKIYSDEVYTPKLT